MLIENQQEGSSEYFLTDADDNMPPDGTVLPAEGWADPSATAADQADPWLQEAGQEQQLTPEELRDLLYNKITVRDTDSDSPQWKENIDQLRAKIDVLDENLLYTLASRMKVSRQIGQYKKNNNIAILQTSRWDAVLAKVVEKGREYDLSEKFLTAVFNAIHEASVDAQNEVISGRPSER
jgi:chorismate mutase